MPELSNWLIEADSGLFFCIVCAVDNESKRIVIISNDNDSVALILSLCYIPEFSSKFRNELWIE